MTHFRCLYNSLQQKMKPVHVRVKCRWGVTPPEPRITGLDPKLPTEDSADKADTSPVPFVGERLSCARGGNAIFIVTR
jgi:hypothetical protein